MDGWRRESLPGIPWGIWRLAHRSRRLQKTLPPSAMIAPRFPAAMSENRTGSFFQAISHVLVVGAGGPYAGLACGAFDFIFLELLVSHSWNLPQITRGRPVLPGRKTEARALLRAGARAPKCRSLRQSYRQRQCCHRRVSGRSSRTPDCRNRPSAQCRWRASRCNRSSRLQAWEASAFLSERRYSSSYQTEINSAPSGGCHRLNEREGFSASFQILIPPSAGGPSFLRFVQKGWGCLSVAS
jgi:hypothetical protein